MLVIWYYLVVKIYTKTGDKGFTSLYGGKRVVKNSTYIEALGSLDELNAILGVVVANCVYKDLRKILFQVQNDLFSIGAEVAMISSTGINSKKKFRLRSSKVTTFERLIDNYTSKLNPLTSFILPGGSFLSSLFHYSRTVCRRTERYIVALNEVEKLNGCIISYLNRLSDLLFTLARYVNKLENIEDVKWKS